MNPTQIRESIMREQSRAATKEADLQKQIDDLKAQAEARDSEIAAIKAQVDVLVNFGL